MSTAFLGSLAALQSPPVSALEQLALIAVAAVLLIGAIRLVTHRQTRKRRHHRTMERDYSALHLFQDQPRPSPGRFLSQRPPTPTVSHDVVAAPVPQPRPEPPAPVASGEGGAVESGGVRFHRPPEGTLQLLPGRLEILAGTDTNAEIRFVKLSGREAAVTFGRSSGEPHVHVQLQSPTVSRMHAAMRYDKGVWRLANLSRTNPVLINGRDLSENGNEHALEDGDRVEMGEIVFRYRAR